MERKDAGECRGMEGGVFCLNRRLAVPSGVFSLRDRRHRLRFRLILCLPECFFLLHMRVHRRASRSGARSCPLADVFLTYAGEGGGVSPDSAPCRAFRNAFHLRSAASSAAPFDPVLPGVFVSLHTRGRSGVSAGSAVPVMFFLSRSGALVPVRSFRFLSLESRRGCAVMGPRRISRSRPHGSKAENVQQWYSIQNKNVFFVPLKKGMEMYNSCRKEHKFAQKPRLIANHGTLIHPLTVSNHHKKTAPDFPKPENRALSRM